jgi:hypothetical protein
VAQVVEFLPNKCEALSLTPSTEKKKYGWYLFVQLINESLSL